MIVGSVSQQHQTCEPGLLMVTLNADCHKLHREYPEVGIECYGQMKVIIELLNNSRAQGLPGVALYSCSNSPSEANQRSHSICIETPVSKAMCYTFVKATVVAMQQKLARMIGRTM